MAPGRSIFEIEIETRVYVESVTVTVSCLFTFVVLLTLHIIGSVDSENIARFKWDTLYVIKVFFASQLVTTRD